MQISELNNIKRDQRLEHEELKQEVVRLTMYASQRHSSSDLGIEGPNAFDDKDNDISQRSTEVKFN